MKICKHCPASTMSTDDVARALGWRWFKGPSQTGKPLDDVACPTCAGRAAPESADAAESFGVRCLTCDWQWEDEYDEGPLTAKQAKEIARNHECEPELQIMTPNGSWRDASAYDRDGNLRPALAGAS